MKRDVEESHVGVLQLQALLSVWERTVADCQEAWLATEGYFQYTVIIFFENGSRGQVEVAPK